MDPKQLRSLFDMAKTAGIDVSSMLAPPPVPVPETHTTFQLESDTDRMTVIVSKYNARLVYYTVLTRSGVTGDARFAPGTAILDLKMAKSVPAMMRGIVRGKVMAGFDWVSFPDFGAQVEDAIVHRMATAATKSARAYGARKLLALADDANPPWLGMLDKFFGGYVYAGEAGDNHIYEVAL